MRSRGEDEAENQEAWTESLHLALQSLGYGTLLMSPDGKVLDADERACAITGRTREELLALEDVMVFVPPEERHLTTERRRRRSDGPVPPAPTAGALLRPDGSRVRIEWASVEIGRESGDLRIAIVLRDATEHVDTQRRIERYERLIDTSPISILAWDVAGVDDPADMRLWAANPAAMNTLPQLVEGELGQRLVDLFPDELHDAARTLQLRGTGTVEHFPDFVIGDPDRPAGVHRRHAVDLGGDVVAVIMENVTGERIESMRRRRLLERLVDAGDDERRTIAMAVHDEPVQQLAAATLLVEALRRHPDAPQRDQRLEAVERSLRATMSGLRRLVFELSPPELVESGLRGALDSAVAYLFEGTRTVVTLDVAVPDEPDRAVQTAAFRIAAEALTNARHHASAAHVLIDLHLRDDALHIDISDDGGGFRTERAATGRGLRTMHERATALGGECEIESGPDGTRVRAVLPLSGRLTPLDASFAAEVAAEAAAATDEIDTLRRERDSLAAHNHRQHNALSVLQHRLERFGALWATLDDPSLEAAALLERAARLVAEVCRDGCGIRFVAPDAGSWADVHAWHPDPDQLDFLRRLQVLHRPDEPSHPQTVLRGNAAVLLDRRASSWTYGGVRPIPPAPIEPNSAILAPIRIDGTPTGVLTVIRDLTADRFVESDVDLVQGIADRLGNALVRAERRGG